MKNLIGVAALLLVRSTIRCLWRAAEGTVRVGSIVLPNPRLDFLELPIGNLGFRFLRNLVVTFDPKNRRVQFRE